MEVARSRGRLLVGVAVAVLCFCCCEAGAAVTLRPPPSAASIVDARLTASLAAHHSAADARAFLDSMQAAGTWPDVNYMAGCRASRSIWLARDHLQRLLVITKAWHQVPSMRSDPRVLVQIVSALDYWLDNDYTEETCSFGVKGANCTCSTPGLWNKNWWQNTIGVQLDLGPVCLLLRNASLFTASHRAHCSRILGRANWTEEADGSMRFMTTSISTGTNTLWLSMIIIYDGLLTHDDAKVEKAFAFCNRELYHTPGAVDGFKKDGSFMQHLGITYAGGYGDSFLSLFLDIYTPAAGTDLTPNAQQREVLSKFVLDHLQWVMINAPNKNFYDPSVVGRQISRKNGLDKTHSVSKLIKLVSRWPRAVEFEAYAQRITEKHGPKLEGNRMFPSSDYMIHRRASYVVSVKGFSTRINNTECVNFENLQGVHMSDGAMFLHQSGNEYYCVNGTSSNAAFPLWDWNHVPGITIDYRVLKLECGVTSSYRGKTSFVGGASDGTYGAFAMHFVTPFRRNLSFQKAWFMFDNEIVVMNANITSRNRSASVHHVLDSKVLNGPVLSSVGGDDPAGSEEMALGASESKPWWLHHDSVGYVFPGNRNSIDGPVTLHLNTTSRSVGSWSSIGDGTEDVELPMFSAWLTGQGPPTINDSLVYVVVPAVTAARFDPAATLAAIDLVSNTPHIQAVYHRQLRLLMAVFWSPTYRLAASMRGWRVSVDRPCVVLIRERAKKLLDITVSDPTHLLASVRVTIDRALKCTVCSRSSDGTGTTLTVSLAEGASTSVTAVVRQGST